MMWFWVTMAAIIAFDVYSGDWRDRRTRVVYGLLAAFTAALGTLYLSVENTFNITAWIFG